METRIDAGMKVASQSDVQSQRGKLVDTNANVTNDQAMWKTKTPVTAPSLQQQTSVAIRNGAAPFKPGSSRWRVVVPPMATQRHAHSNQTRMPEEYNSSGSAFRDPCQLGDVISPRTWSEIIAQDIAVLSEGSQYRNEGSDSCAENKLGNAMKSESGTKRRLYVQDVTFHVEEPNGRDSPILQRNDMNLSDGLITSRTWNNMIKEDRFEPQASEIAAAVETSSDLKDLSPDPLSSSIQYAWPNGIRVVDGQGSSDSNQPDETRPENTSPGTERLESSIQMLRRELKSMRQIDQKIFRQLLRNYEMIGEMLDHVHVTMVTPSSTPSPYPASPCSTPSSPEKSKTYAADSGDADLLNIVREALAQPGSLNIQKIVTQLSPIRRRRSSEPPPVEYDDLPLNFDAEDDDIEADDLLSFSCPVLKQPVAPSKRKSLPNLPDGT